MFKDTGPIDAAISLSCTVSDGALWVRCPSSASFVAASQRDPGQNDLHLAATNDILPASVA